MIKLWHFLNLCLGLKVRKALVLTLGMMGFGPDCMAFVEYKVDYKPMEAFPDIHKEYQKSTEDVMHGRVSIDKFRRRIEMLEKVLAKSPNWVDGLWLLASDSFQLASYVRGDKYKTFALSLLTKGEIATRRCLKIEADNPLCKLFLGSSLAKKGTIEGVMTALDHAQLVEKLWLDVAQSKFNIKFTNELSMQGAVRYALGIFYRLVPDYAALEWVYGVRGDIEKSVKYHRVSLSIDDKNLPCSNLMLGVALICKSESKKDQAFAEGINYLRQAGQPNDRVYTVNSSICRNDSAKLIAHPEDACDYSIVGQQTKGSEEEFKKKKPNSH